MKPRIVFVVLMLLAEHTLILHSQNIGRVRADSFPLLSLNDTTDKRNAPPAEFIIVDKEPTIVKRADPKYPEEAIRKGLEGIVWLKIWVGTDGLPRQVAILKSSAEVFSESAVEAAKQFVFTPAYLNNKPVAVWVSVPFKFKLQAKPEDEAIQRNIKELAPTLKKPTILTILGPKGLDEKIVYPEEAKKKRIQGAVFASVVLNEEMGVSELKVTRGIGGGCDEEVMKALLAYRFNEDKEFTQREDRGPVRIVVQFLLPSK